MATTCIQKRSSTASSIKSEEGSTPSHPYNTRYSSKFFTKARSDGSTRSHSEVSLLSNEGIINQEDATAWELRRTIMNNPRSGSRICNCSRTSRPGFISRYWKSTLFVLTILLLCMGYAYLCDRFVDGIEKNLDILTDEVRQMQVKILQISRDMSNSISENLHQNLQVSQENVINYVKAGLEQFNADKTGRTDYALESAGGQILSTRNTIPFNQDTSLAAMFGIKLCGTTNSARAIIQPNSLPGECWAFKGQAGAVVIKLISKVYVQAVSMEHIAASISPSGHTKSAPKEFTIWGLKNLDDQSKSFYFGKFVYDIKGPTLQYFKVKHRSSNSFSLIEMKIESNHGNEEHTCVYRLRIHGSLDSPVFGCQEDDLKLQ